MTIFIYADTTLTTIGRGKKKETKLCDNFYRSRKYRGTRRHNNKKSNTSKGNTNMKNNGKTSNRNRRVDNINKSHEIQQILESELPGNDDEEKN